MVRKRKQPIPPEAALSGEVAELMRWVRFVNEFRRIERVIWYKGVDGRERNGEHCYQLLMVAWYLRERRAPHLDLFKVMMYVSVHDVQEIYAVDTPAFRSRFGEFEDLPTHADKKEREAAALKRIEREWGGVFPDLIEWIEAYERQEDEESKFVYALDKLLSELNIFEDRGRTDKRLGLTLKEKVSYKRPRIAKHPLLLEYYDELCEFMERYHQDKFYDPSSAKREPAAE